MTWWCAASPAHTCDALICDGAVRSGKTVCMALSFLCWATACFDGATGIYCGYLDFIAWDLPAVLDAAQAEFEASPVSWANFHVFRRDAQTISLVDKEKADEDSAPTNSKLLS